MMYPLGKLPAEHLARLLARYAPFDERVVLGPGVGRDAAVISFGDRYLVAKADPITFATDEIGWYAVHVNANDVACTGATVRWFLATLLLPEGRTDPPLVDAIFDQIAVACAELGVGLVGGHTEITHGLDRAIVAGCIQSAFWFCENQATSGACQTEGTNSNFSARSVTSLSLYSSRPTKKAITLSLNLAKVERYLSLKSSLRINFQSLSIRFRLGE